jgi:nucleosome binding factor SPN SPT16 subunit
MSMKHNLWKSVNLLEIPVGSVSAEESGYFLCASIGEWLLGYEFTDTLMIIDFTLNNEQIWFLTSAKKAEYLNDLKKKLKLDSSSLPKAFEVLDRKNVTYDDLLAKMKKVGKKIGVVQNEKPNHRGKFVKEWYTKFDKDTQLEQQDVENALRDVLSVKSAQELGYINDASKIVSRALEKIFKPKMEDIIDKEKKITHAKLSSMTEEAIVAMKLKKKNDQDDVDIEVPFPPVIQSGGVYDLKVESPAKETNLHFGTICCILGAKFRSHCAIVGRTYMIDASKQQAANYQLLTEVYKLIVRKLKPGVELGSIYDSAADYIKKKNPALSKHFINNVGFGIGLLPTDPYTTIQSGNKLVAEKGMAFCIMVGFNNIEETQQNKITDEKRRIYSLVLADTVALPVDSQQATVYTSGEYEYDDVSYAIDDDEEANSKKKKKVDDDVEMLDVSEVRSSRTREKKGTTTNAEDLRRQQQEELRKKKRDEYNNQSTGGKGKGKDKENFSVDAKLAKGDIFAYKAAPDYPPAKHNRIVVDKKRDTVLLPMNGTHVPYHIATIKNVSKTEEADCMHLRINFKSSKQNFGKTYAPAKLFPNTFFIKEVSYKSREPKYLTEVLRDILELRKKISQRERDINEKRKDVQKGDLQLTKGVRPPRLTDVYMRPGKKTNGIIEAHENGIRFSSQKGERVDILYGNIKHAFFQAAQKDLIVLLHFHLDSPIMIGKKAHTDIQFYTDVIEEYDHLVGRHRRNTTDRESIEEEHRERQLKQKLNKEFHTFAKKVEDKAGFEFDIPYRDLEFSGTPFRSSVNLVPTVNCLVSLTEYPFFVMPLDEVEIVHFERVKFGLKNFDMVLVLKDYSKPVQTINSIPIDKLETLKDWLNQVEIPYFEGPMTLVWPKIMKTIREDSTWNPWGEGGWASFLDSGASDDEDDEPQEDDYKPDEDGYSSEEYASPDEYSDEDENFSDEEEDDGEDWDTLLSKAHASDEKKRSRGKDYSDDEEEKARPAKRKKK